MMDKHHQHQDQLVIRMGNPHKKDHHPTPIHNFHHWHQCLDIGTHEIHPMLQSMLHQFDHMPTDCNQPTPPHDHFVLLLLLFHPVLISVMNNSGY